MDFHVDHQPIDHFIRKIFVRERCNRKAALQLLLAPHFADQNNNGLNHEVTLLTVCETLSFLLK